SDPLLSALLTQGLVRPDPLFLGLDASHDGALIDRNGVISDSLYAAGPSRKGSQWESTAVPEIREQVQQLALHLVDTFGQAHHARLDHGHQQFRQATSA